MKSIFERGDFGYHPDVRLDEARGSIPLVQSAYASRKTNVFISHKHDDLEDLKNLLAFLENNYNVKVYIDSKDPTMPKTTSAKTGATIKERIKQCDKFILLATNGAIESKWCNWELGFGDAHKYLDHIALLPLKSKGSTDGNYKGSEYMDLYPYIVYCDGTEHYNTGALVKKGYYIYNKSKNSITSLDVWLNRRQ